MGVLHETGRREAAGFLCGDLAQLGRLRQACINSARERWVVVDGDDAMAVALMDILADETVAGESKALVVDRTHALGGGGAVIGRAEIEGHGRRVANLAGLAGRAGGAGRRQLEVIDQGGADVGSRGRRCGNAQGRCLDIAVLAKDTARDLGRGRIDVQQERTTSRDSRRWCRADPDAIEELQGIGQSRFRSILGRGELGRSGRCFGFRSSLGVFSSSDRRGRLGCCGIGSLLGRRCVGSRFLLRRSQRSLSSRRVPRHQPLLARLWPF